MFGDLLIIGQWWLILFVLGISALPFACFFFDRFIDLGYGFTKTIATLVVVFLSFLLATAKIVPFSRTLLLFVSAIFLIINFYLYQRNKKALRLQLLKKVRVLVIQELLFMTGLVLWSLVRAYQPDINGLEKFMDYGFINSILKSKTLPPADMWYAGEIINYYWFGHLIVASLTKLTNIPPAISFNLMLATIFGATLTGSFSIASTLAHHSSKLTKERTSFVVGLITAIILTLAGNFHTPLYLLKDGVDKYWYPDATRFIGYNPETNDKTIHEFPLYSFVVSDLHAHLINLPHVMLFIGLLLALFLSRKTKGKFPLKRIFPLGFLLGILFMTSAWDTANYSLTTGIALLLFGFKQDGWSAKTLWSAIKPFIIIVPTALLTSLPFLIHFKSITQGIKLANSHSPLWQLFVLWGFPFILMVSFGFLIINISRLNKKINTSDLFATSLLVSSLALITLPEIVFLKDIYVATHHRANTMFKLTYQAFVMSYLTSGYIVFRLLSFAKGRVRRSLIAVFFTLTFSLVLIYPWFAIRSYYNNLKFYRGLNGESWLLSKHPEEYEIINWFRENVPDQPVILEAPGDSYTESNLVSAYTGLPTISGWFVHEWLWRGSADIPQKRVANAANIYTSPDLELTKYLLKRHQIKYVIIGTLERQKYPNLQTDKFNRLGKIVFASKNTKIFQIESD